MPSCPCYRRVDLRKWPDLCCFCVARSRPAQPSRRHPPPARVGLPRGRWRTAATTHQPARRPAASGAMLGITYRDEQTCAKRFEPRISIMTRVRWSGRRLLTRAERPVRWPGTLAGALPNVSFSFVSHHSAARKQPSRSTCRHTWPVPPSARIGELAARAHPEYESGCVTAHRHAT